MNYCVRSYYEVTWVMYNYYEIKSIGLIVKIIDYTLKNVCII